MDEIIEVYILLLSIYCFGAYVGLHVIPLENCDTLAYYPLLDISWLTRSGSAIPSPYIFAMFLFCISATRRTSSTVLHTSNIAVTLIHITQVTNGNGF